jgi:DNA polymerase I
VDDQQWLYNAQDCVRTYEIYQTESKNITSMGLANVNSFQQELFYPVLSAMLRGVRIDTAARAKMAEELLVEMSRRDQFFIETLGHPLNPRSGPQMQALFYTDLKLPIQLHKKTRQPTLEGDALDRLAVREPLIRPIVRAIQEYRSLGVFLGTFVNAPLDIDGRMRCSYNICGAETYRFSSSKNAFGSGTNLQNVPNGSDEDGLHLPNIRKIFIPDEGYTFFDLDLNRADLYVVVWEADDQLLKEVLAKGWDMHLVNAVDIYEIKGIPYDELSELHPNYPNHRARVGYTKRHGAKEGVHATNYGCKGRTLAATMGTTVHEADRFISRWLQAHPGILAWHRRTEEQLKRTRKVTNRFGYERFYFDRIESVLPEALAWIPQSTVACVINRIWKNIYDRLSHVQVLLQVHDSLGGQYPSSDPTNRQQILDCSRIVVPYREPLTIPCGIKTSIVSWGDCT